MSKILKLRAGRELTARGGYGVSREPSNSANTPAVFWTKGNSYVVSQKTDGQFVIYSINGIGEIRWDLNPYEMTSVFRIARYGAVIDYFFEWVDEAVESPDLRLRLDDSGLGKGRRLIGFDPTEQEILVSALRIGHAVLRAELEEQLEHNGNDDAPDLSPSREWVDLVKNLFERVKKELDLTR